MKKIAFRLNFLTACVSLGIASQASAGHTYFGINYQYYRDFAENKGKFTVGAQDIDIYNKKGEMIGTMMKGVPMPDLSSLAKGGYATLVGDQTLISVAHNVGYQDVDFGMTGHNPDQHNFKYKVVKRYNYKNDSTHRYMTDYQHPRLAKFVTEVAPIEMVSRMNGKVYTDLKKYPMRVRVGSGHQYWKDDNNNTNADLAYGGAWLTGGNTFMDGGTGDGHLYLNGRVQTPNEYGPLPIAGAQGDSGSPFFIYDKEQGKWLLNGVLREGHPYAAVGNGYQIARQDYLEEVLEQDLAARFFLNNANYTLKTTQDGNGTITQNGRRSQTIGLYNSALPFDSRGGNNGDEAPTYKGPNPWSPALHHGKNIYLGDMGKGTLTIENTVNQGAGGLYFEGDFAVKPSDNTVTWQGAGVSVGEESTVEWQVHNPEGDRLSKIGLGTLLVNGKGKNLGSLSVGNGLVVLDQQADDVGQKQAFKEVGIVSGRATVKLNSENQVDPNNIYFGFRGGRLDLNGHSLTFERIQNIDEGAMLVNRNETQAANITITGNATVNSDAKQLTNKKYIAFNGWFGEQDKAKTNGRLNVNYQPVNAENHLLLSGGTNLNGNITQNGGTLVFSGRPTPHAYNHLNQNHAKMEGSTRGEVIIDDDWINRTFTAENFQIQNGQAVVSRNVSAINGNWQLSNNAKATFGVTPNQENLVCIRSDWTGLTECKSENLTEQKTIDSLPRTKVNGNVHLMSSASAVASGLVDLIGNVSLAQNSQFTLSHNATQTGSLNLVNQANATVNNARLMGNVTLSDSAQFNLANSRFSHQISGTESTTVNLENANWTMPASTTLGSLALNNSEITLNPDFVTQANNSQFNTLTINGNLSGNGIFNYRTYLHQYLGDKLEVNGQAQGDFKLKVHNTGAEPTALEHLTLMTLQQMPSSGLNVTLADNYVDVGTWRYELVKDGNQYRLYSPMKEAELQAEEAKRLAEEQRKAEEAKRLAEEQRKAEEAKRLAEEQRKAEEAKRLAEEQRKAEEAKRLAEEQRKAEEAKRKQKELISRYSNSALSELSATVNGMLSVQHELDRVFVSDSDLSVWTNITQDKKRYDSDDFRAYQQNMNLRQIGVKKKVGNGRIGAIFSHGRANNTFDDQISNQMDLTMVSAFAQYQWHDWQLGVNSGYGVSSSKISGEQSQKIHRRVMSYGLNANYQFRLGELGVQPYLGVSRHFIEGENYQYEGVNIQTPKIAFNSYTTGVKVDYTFTPAQDVTIKPYFSVNYVDASNARVQTKVNQATLQQQFGRYWQKELGVSGEISHFHMSVYAAQSQGSQLSKQRTLGVKLGYRW